MSSLTWLIRMIIKYQTRTLTAIMSSAPAFRHYAKAQTNFKPPEIANGNAFLGDVFSKYVPEPTIHLSSFTQSRLPPFMRKSPRSQHFISDKIESQAPISCGFYRLEPGAPLDYTYTYHEMKIILEGDFTISDETGQKVTCGPGDVLNFPKGSKIRFTTEKGGLAFYTGQVCCHLLFSFLKASQDETETGGHYSMAESIHIHRIGEMVIGRY